MLLLMVGTLLAMLAVVTSWGSDIDGQAKFRIEIVRPVGAVRRRGTTIA